MSGLAYFPEISLELNDRSLYGRNHRLGHLGHGTLQPLQIGAHYVCLESPQPFVPVLNALHDCLVASDGSLGCDVVQLLVCEPASRLQRISFLI